MELPQLLVAYVIITLGAICQSSIGMGFALVTVPFLLMLNPAYVPISIISSGLVLSLLIFQRDRTAIDLSGVGIALIGRFLGTAVAAGIFVVLPQDLFPAIIGSLILFGVLMSLMKPAWNPTPPTLLGAGILSGIMGTLAGVGGLSIGLLYQHQKGPVVRGTLAGFLGIGSLVSLLSLFAIGKFSRHDFRLFLMVLPALVLGFALSRFTIHRLDRGRTRLAILLVSALSGIIVIIRSLLQYL